MNPAFSESSKSNIKLTEEDDKLYSKLEIELRSHDAAVMKSYTNFATMAASNLGIELGNWLVTIFLQSYFQKYTYVHTFF